MLKTPPTLLHNKATAQDAEEIRKLVGAGKVFYGNTISEDYARDELAVDTAFPDILVEPETTEEVAAVIRYANERVIPVIPRGMGTGLCGGAVASRGGIMISTVRMNKILEIDQECLMATVQPGVILMDFQKEVEKLGLFYPPEPGEKSATVGGNVATNAGGMRAVKYGVTRDYVRGLEVVLPDGQVTEIHGKLAKSSSGYSLMHLMIGSEGTLGFITKIVVRLLPLPRKKVSLLVPFPSLAKAIGAVPKVLTSRTSPTAIEFMQTDVIHVWEKAMGKRFPHATAPAYLLLQFDGNSMAELEAVYEKAAEVCLAAGALDVLIADTGDRQASLWEARSTFLEAMKTIGQVELADAVVPPHLIPEFVTYCDSLSEKHGVKVWTYGHAGDGNCHIHILREKGMEEEKWRKTLPAVMDDIFRKAHELGGQVSGEHGIGEAKRKYFLKYGGEVNIELMRRIKSCLDPKGIMNPGKVV
ncbi:MAG TPA: FAD-binding protein [Firmicutes bacterium]|nr:FAD-binding protein [Bacillota bacterium]